MATINYNGMKLEEITEPQIFDPPQEMLVWDFESCSSNAISKKKVLAIFPNRMEYRLKEIKPILATDGTKWNFCANVPAPRRATNRELSKWLAQGNGELKCASLFAVKITIDYGTKCDNDPCHESYKVRKWDDTEWHEPDVDYMGIEVNDEK